MIDFLAGNGFQQYCYAPKSDDRLRKHWQESWGREMFNELTALSDYAHSRSIEFGLGLSPLSLLQQWPSQRAALNNKLAEISRLSPDFLAILFDDTRGDMPGLAERQCEIMHAVAECLPDTRLLMCPTYYSFDPVLEELFGAMPDDYWGALGEQLDREVGLLWTGDKVISTGYPARGLERICGLFRRKPVIWDNSRVNDGRKTSPFIPLEAMSDGKSLYDHAAGLLVNPMNQPALAMIVLLTLKLEGEPHQRLDDAITIIAPGLRGELARALPLIRDKGLDKLDAADRQELESLFADHNHPAAVEIRQWLAGHYRFAPDCLT